MFIQSTNVTSKTVKCWQGRLAVAVYVVLCLGIAPSAAGIEDIPTPAAPDVPFQPYLELDSGAPICQELLRSAQEAFFTRSYVIDVRGSRFRGSRYGQVLWPFTPDQPGTGYEIAYSWGSNRVVGIFNKEALIGNSFVIAWAQWSHSWRGQIHALRIYPSIQAFRDALREVVRAKRGLAFNLAGGIEFEIDPWTAPTLIQDQDAFFLLEGYKYDDRRRIQRLMISPIAGEGKNEPICSVRLEPQDVFTIGPDSIARLFRLLDLVIGEECGGGTLNPLTGQKLVIAGLASRVLLRPWAATIDPRNTREAVDTWLKHWRLQSLSQAINHRRLQSTLFEAENDLRDFYQDSFDYTGPQAAKISEFIVDWLLRMHFKFPQSIDPGQQASDEVHRVKAAILSGAPIEEVAAMLVQITGEEPDPADTISAALTSALERSEVLNLLLAQGADVNHGNAFDKTPLMFAAHFDLIEATKTLLASGADPNRKTSAPPYQCPIKVDIADRTALFYAAENASSEMVRLLIANGADTHAVDSRGIGVLEYLEKNDALSDHDRRALRAVIAQQDR